MKKSGVIVAVFLLIVSCTSAPIRNIQNQTVPDIGNGTNFTLDQVESAIITGAISRGWTPRKISDGMIEARITVRTHEAVVDIPYTASTYSILYKGSSNLDYRNGNIHRNFNRWIANLAASVQRELALKI